MIALKRLNNEEFLINADLIETLEARPDTIMVLTSGKKLIVKNSIEDIVRKVLRYKQLCHQSVQVLTSCKDENALPVYEVQKPGKILANIKVPQTADVPAIKTNSEKLSTGGTQKK